MRTGKQVIKIIGWALVIVGFVMRFTNVSFNGKLLVHRHGWENTSMNGNALIFFGLVFLIPQYFKLKKSNSDNY